ncbi:hypothetical protein H7H78_03045 [Mycobacterium shinjukuense]|uniref:Uncharacterized protein n=1 Tax=Mycobacterium shinjukuense TaxID=398694 RepID=A0A7I7MJ25_9MYCO|nr:hypothetical protein [Mycobacterium shinjukuense]MCV6984459.1 hypothetical protein [Mycobacterium shinjukuense]BBX72156.1 hypothetical protein MSHI_00620 [Mycobacterium shinjukuense]
MGFVIQWLCYLVAFLAGSAVAWVVGVSITRSGDDEPVAAPPEAGRP